MTAPSLLPAILWVAILFSGSLAFGESRKLQQLPASADSYLYYDFTLDGRLLKVDYLERTARQVARVRVDPDAPPLFGHGWVLENPLAVVVVSPELRGPGRHATRVHLMQDGEFVPTDFHLNGARGGNVAGLDDKIVLVRPTVVGPERITGKREEWTVFDAAANRVIDHVVLPAGDWVEVARTKGDSVIATIMYRAWTSRIGAGPDAVSEVDVAEFSPFDNWDGPFVQHAGPRGIVLATHPKDRDRTHISLVDSEGRSVQASAMLDHALYGRFWIDREGAVHCIEQGEKRLPTGRLFSFHAEGQQLQQAPVVEFDAATHFVVRDGNDRPVVTERVRFDYVSLLAVPGIASAEFSGHTSARMIYMAPRALEAAREGRLGLHPDFKLPVRKLIVDSAEPAPR